MANANITISFTTYGADESIDLSLELDEILNNDVTTFKFGARAYFRIFTNATTIDIYNTDGTIGDNGMKTMEVEETIIFTTPPTGSVEDNTVELQHVPKSAPVFTKIGGTSLSLSMSAEGSKTVVANKAGISVYKATYTTEYYSKYLENVNAPAGWPTDEDYPVVVVVVAS